MNTESIAIKALQDILKLEDKDGMTRNPSWRFNRALQIAGNAYRYIYNSQQDLTTTEVACKLEE